MKLYTKSQRAKHPSKQKMWCNLKQNQIQHLSLCSVRLVNFAPLISVATINKHWSALARLLPRVCPCYCDKKSCIGSKLAAQSRLAVPCLCAGGDGRCRRCWCCYHRHKTLHHAVFCAAVFDGNQRGKYFTFYICFLKIMQNITKNILFCPIQIFADCLHHSYNI